MFATATSKTFVQDGENRALFSRRFDHTPFLFRHGFDQVSLFQMPALLKLAERAMQKRNRSHYESGQVEVNGYFGGPPADVTIIDALRNIESGRNWVILKRIHEEPEYRDFLNGCLVTLSDLSEMDIKAEFHDPIVTVFITSPNRITPYHMDSEANFLAQTQGSKTVYLYDGKNQNVLTNRDLERYWTGHFDAAKYKDELEQYATRFDLGPGLGVFNPATFPHWVQNGGEVSVSVSVNIKRKQNRLASVHRTNYYMRRLGLAPSEPGRSQTLDRMKHLVFGKPYNMARSTRRYLRTLGI